MQVLITAVAFLGFCAYAVVDHVRVLRRRRRSRAIRRWVVGYCLRAQRD